jgi:hypothetical protein
MAPRLATTHALQVRTTQPPLGIVPGTMHIHPTCLIGVRGWAKSQVLWCNMHNVRVGAQMVKLATLQLVQPIGARSTTGGPINQEAGAPPPLGFPHTMLNVKRVKDNIHWKALYHLRDRDQRADKMFELQTYVVREQKLFVWHQLCSVTESYGLVLVWQHVAWSSARCVEKRAIH